MRERKRPQPFFLFEAIISIFPLVLGGVRTAAGSRRAELRRVQELARGGHTAGVQRRQRRRFFPSGAVEEERGRGSGAGGGGV